MRNKGKKYYRLRSFSRLASAISFLVGFLVIIGWIFEIPVLKSVLPNFVTMKFNTALCFMLLGISLWLLIPEQSGQRARVMAKVFAFVVAIIGALSLSEYILGWNLRIDQLLFKETAEAVGTSHPGRMAPSTALNFAMLGIALFLLGTKKKHIPYITQVLAFVIILIGFMNFTGYIYGVRALYGISSYTQMALHTSVIFILLGLGVLFVRPDQGLMATASGIEAGSGMLRRILPAAVVIPLMVGWLRLIGERSGLYDTEFGVALFGIIQIVVLSIVIWINAVVLNRIDLERKQAEEALQKAHDELEKRVHERTSELIRTVEVLHKTNRALKILSECNQALVRSTDEEDLLHKVCRVIVEIGGYRLAWVGYAEQDEKKTVRPVAQAGYEEGYLETLGITWADTEYGRGPSGTAIRTRKPAIFNNISTDLAIAPWREDALKRGYTSVIGLPLIINSDSIGALTICAGEHDAFHDDEVKLLTELTNDLAYGIAALRIREKQRQAEEALQRSKAYLQLQIDRMPIGCIIWSPDFRIMTWNPAAEKIFGFTADEVLGKHPYNLIVPKDAQLHVDTIWRRLLEGDATAYSVNENTTKDGRVITCDWSNTPLKDDGTVIGVLSMVQDITERKQAEEKLAIERNRFVTASLAGRVALWEWDLRYGALEWSDIVDSILGYEAGDFPRTIQAWEELIHPDDRPHVMQMLERHLEQGTPYDTEYRVRTKEGSYIWWRDIGTCRRDEHGKAYQMSGACTDITTRKRTEEELKKYRDHLEEMVRERTADLEQASEALRQSERELSIRNKIANIFLTATTDEEMYNDVLNVILEFMESKYGVIGYIDEDGSLVVPSMSRHIWDKCQVPDKTYVFPGDKWGDSSWPRAIREKKTNYTNKVSTLTPKGHIAVSKHISMPIIYQGEVIGLIQIANKETDYTDKDVQLLESLGNIIAPILNARLQRDRQEKARRQAEESLRIANASLREHAEELEQQKAEAEEAKFQAEYASRAKSDFLANMSHELRTPLNAIIGFSEIMNEGMAGPLNESQKEYLNDIYESGKHLLSLINDILDLSKVESGKMDLELSEFNIRELIESILVMFREKAIKHNFKITTEINEEIEYLIADERRIKQVLFNLLSNAMKFTPDGGSITVRARKVKSSELGVAKRGDLKSPTLEKGDLGGFLNEKDSKLSDFDYVEISVEDTGIGISEEDKQKLFQPFQQLETTLEKKYAGTGLGLSLSKRIVELHGGKIWVESKVGKGSKFSFVIPVRQGGNKYDK